MGDFFTLRPGRTRVKQRHSAPGLAHRVGVVGSETNKVLTHRKTPVLVYR